MTDPANRENMFKILSRRNWYRNTAIAATCAVMLFLTGCTKEVLDMLPKRSGGGGLGSTPVNRYRFKANYRTQEGATKVGYFAPVETKWWVTDYSEILMVSNSLLFFNVHSADELGAGWQYWKTSDGFWLSLSYAGFLYRSDSTNRVAWKIVNGKLYNNYWKPDNWQDYPAGAKYYGGFIVNDFIIEGYYVGVGYANELTLTNCELVPVP